MSEQLPPSVLFFNLHDPSYRAYLPAEAAHASQLQCQPLSVITAISIQDSSGIHEIYPLTSDAIEEQARCVLEDIRVQAIKVNHLYSLEALTVVAQVAADYEDVPMVLTLGAHYLASLYEDEEDVDQLLDSYLEVLAPHVHTVILDMTYADQWLSSDSQLENAEDIINHCFAAGVEYCLLLSNTNNKEMVYNSLYHTSGTVEHFTYDPPALRQPEFSDIFSTSLTCLIAQQLPMSEACKQAIILSLNQFANQTHLGMGRPQVNRLIAYDTTYTADNAAEEKGAAEENGAAIMDTKTTVDSTTLNTPRFPTGLYGINPDWEDFTRLYQAIEQACQAGLPVLQWRRKHLSAEQALEQASEILALCRRYGTLLLINDDWRLALAIGADGVHLGRDDEDVATVRQAIEQRSEAEPFFIGVSCYNRLDLAQQAVQDGVDYFAFGAIFSSTVKPEAVNAPLELFAQARNYFTQAELTAAQRPTLVGIGGITLANAHQVIQAGCESLAVISGLFEQDDIGATTRQFIDLFNQYYVKQ